MRYALDLTKRHFLRRKGTITVIGSWLRDEDDNYEPCLVLVRTGEEMAEHTIPCIVTLADAWIWSEEVGDEIKAGHAAGGFLHALRLDGGDPRVIVRLLSVIRDNLGDLISMPPFLPELGEVEAEITHRDSTGRTREVEVRAHV